MAKRHVEDWASLPNDCLLLVLSRVSGRDAALCAAVCRGWRVAAECEVLWRDMCARELQLSSLGESTIKRYSSWHGAYANVCHTQHNWSFGRCDVRTVAAHKHLKVGEHMLSERVEDLYIYGSRIVSLHSGHDRTTPVQYAHLWDVESGQCIRLLALWETAHGQQVRLVGDGPRVAIAEESWGVRVFDLESGAPVCETANGGTLGKAHALALDSTRLASAHVSQADRSAIFVRVWELNSANVMQPKQALHLRVHGDYEDAVFTLGLFPNRVECAAVFDDEVIRCWDVVQQRQLSQIAPSGTPHKRQTLKLAITPTRIISRSATHVRAWDKLTGTMQQSLQLHGLVRHPGYSKASVAFLSVSRCYQYVVTMSRTARDEEPVIVRVRVDTGSMQVFKIHNQRLREHLLPIGCLFANDECITIGGDGQRLSTLSFTPPRTLPYA